MDIAIIPKGWLKSGENSIHIGYSDENYDDFVIDNLVLWFKIKELDEAPGGKIQGTKKDIDSLEDLSAMEGKVLKADEPFDHFPE